jgi:hypothetical protein
MTPKEKAKELIDKFKNRSIELGETHSQLMAEANALIAVDEIMKLDVVWYQGSRTYEFYEEVKQEIEKL